MANQAMTQSYKTTKEQILNKSLHVPFSGPDGLPAVKAMLGRLTFSQDVAATLAAQKRVARHAGKIRKLLIEITDAPTTTETMTYDVQVNGVSILSATPQLTSADTTTTGLYDILSLLAAAKTPIAVGDVITVVRTLANGAALTYNAVIVEWG